jgi:hypothetical protein
MMRNSNKKKDLKLQVKELSKMYNKKDIGVVEVEEEEETIKEAEGVELKKIDRDINKEIITISRKNRLINLLGNTNIKIL